MNAATQSRPIDPAPVTVIGLGAMGSALATAFLKAGHPTTVWNRTPGRAEPLVAEGAALAPTPRDAAAASPIVLMSLLDYAAVRNVLEQIDGTLRGRVLVNLTSGPPEDARAILAWANDAGVAYLDGAVMVPTPMIGTPEALILYSGSRPAFDEHRETLSALAVDNDFLGGDAGLASIYDLGMLDVFFTGMTSFLHAAALVAADKVDAASFAPYAQRMASLLHATFPELARDVDAEQYSGEQDTLEMELAAVEHIVEASASRGVTTAVPELTAGLIRRSIALGHGKDGFSRVVELLRSSAPGGRPGR